MSTTPENTETQPGLGRRLLRPLLILAGLAVVVFVIASSVVMVDETEYVLVERLGDIVAVYDRPEDRGFHVKAPWPIDVVRRFDNRVQLFDPPGREIFSSDKKNITVDAYVCWKIAEPRDGAAQDVSGRPVVRFFRGLGNSEIAEARLDARVRSILTTQLGRVELSRLFNVENPERGPVEEQTGALEDVSRKIYEQVVRQPGEQASLSERLGIEIVDVRIQRINLPLGNQQAVFDRMKSERRKIAERYRSAGMAEKTKIESQADRQAAELLARARADAERIRGEAQAKAIEILNRAHAQDEEFYRVMRTLDSYRKILNDKTTLVLSASSNLLKLLTEGIGEGPVPVPETPAAAPMTSDAGEKAASGTKLNGGGGQETGDAEQ